MTRTEYERAYMQGIAARQAGKAIESNPYRNKSSLKVLSDAWQSGWNETDRLRRNGK